MADSPVPTTPPLVSLEVFHGITWAGFALCVIAFSSRVAIRVMCTYRLLAEDYMMGISLCLLLAATIIGQLSIKYIYIMVDVSNGATPSADFLSQTTTGLRSFGVLMILNYVGIWLVKFNFLLFFRRLGNRVKKYRVFWWVVLAYNIAAGAVVIGLIDFKCVMPDAAIVFATCSGAESVIGSYTAAKVSCTLDVIGDAMIIGFPCWILWNCKVSLQKKLVLSAIFGLVTFTIAVTIIRGSIFGGVYQSITEHHMKQMNITWIWFWFNIEFVVAFTIGCLVSFRSLYTQKDNSIREAEVRERQRAAAVGSFSKPKGLRARARLLHDELLTTFQSWEGTTRFSDDRFSLPVPPTGRMSVDFEHDYNRAKEISEVSHSRSKSFHTDTTRAPESRGSEEV